MKTACICNIDAADAVGKCKKRIIFEKLPGNLQKLYFIFS